MKHPFPLNPIRRGQRGRLIEARRFVPAPDPRAGIAPQDIWCEDTCHSTYEVGSEEHENCLDFCRED